MGNEGKPGHLRRVLRWFKRGIDEDFDGDEVTTQQVFGESTAEFVRENHEFGSSPERNQLPTD